MPQALKSKWFRVATEGATTDGRAIQRVWIEQMAKNFNPAKYGARVWVEHMRGLLPDSAFAAQGDVLAVKAEAVEDGKLALFAQIKPLESLMAMNKAGQKLYTSIEVDPNFADTGEAYLTGLAVTDSPASLGTEMLTFAAQNPGKNPLSNRKSNAGTLFSEGVAFTLEVQDPAPDQGGLSVQGFFAALREMVAGAAEKPAATPAPVTPAGATQFSAQQQAALQGVQQFVEQQKAALDKLQGQFSSLEQKHDALVQQLSQQSQGPARPAAAGGNGQVLAEF